MTVVAYVVALNAPESIFELAIQYAFSGFAALSPLLVARSSGGGSTQVGRARRRAVDGGRGGRGRDLPGDASPPRPRARRWSSWRAGGLDLVTRTPGGTTVLGFMPVVPMVLVSALLMIVVSLLTRGPAAATLGRYFTPAAK